jgi:hypothetical protein
MPRSPPLDRHNFREVVASAPGHGHNFREVVTIKGAGVVAIMNRLVGYPPMELIRAAASRALGTDLTDPVDLGGSRRSTVLRCRTGTAETVVVKAYRDEPEALRGFTAEAAGLALVGAGPRLLAVDSSFPLIVMEDLGDAPSLADKLLGGDPDAARQALLTWATGYGRLAAATVGREPELAALYTIHDRGDRTWNDPGWLYKDLGELPAALDSVGVTPPPRLDEDLAVIAAVADPGHYPVFSPGDICPDNNLLTPRGLRVLDFESAGYHPVFLDAAYTRMPFATCWCVFRLPADVRTAVERAYRDEVVTAYPDLGDDSVWQPGVRLATAAWTVAMTALRLPRTAAEDRPTHPTRRPVPTARQLLRYRWQTLRCELESAAELPAVVETLRRLRAATESWAVPDLPTYPAFR